MAHQFSAIMFTDGVKAAQAEFGSREKQAVFSERAPVNDALTAREAAFIAQRDTFYMATVNTDGWPYVQHRGGPPGFLRVLGPRQLAYADFRGNTQLVSMGNSRNNNRVSLILMDYPNRRRLKILGHLRYEDARDCLPEQLAAVALDEKESRFPSFAFGENRLRSTACNQRTPPLVPLASLDSPNRGRRVAFGSYKARIERIVHIDLVAFDWNCPQHITRRYTPEEFAALAEAANVSHSR
jgi:predicted pyridoxine 5'-phosphate oxidase superfamily flavin-nucleotide-binding protein